MATNKPHPILPAPADASPDYAAGWDKGDILARHFGDLNADAPTNWSDEMCNGFWDRLTEARKWVA